MALMTGLSAYMGFANESTWGTFAAGVMYIQDLLGESLKRVKPSQFDEFLNGTIHRLNPIFMPEHSEGNFKMRNSFEGCEYPLYHLLGSSVTPGKLVTGVGKWTFVPATALPTGLSISMNRPVGGTVGLFKYPGIKIKSATFDFDSGLPGVMTFETIGGSPIASAIEATAAIETGKTPKAYAPILATYGDVTIVSTSRKAYVSKASVKVDNTLADNLVPIAGTSIVEPQRNGTLKIGGTLDVWMDSAMHTAMFTPFAAGTDVAITLTYTGGPIPGSSPSTNYLFSITMPYCTLGPSGAPCCDSAGVVTVPYAFESHCLTTSDVPITITVWNSDQADLT